MRDDDIFEPSVRAIAKGRDAVSARIGGFEMQLSMPIHHLKRRAKLTARQQNIPLHEALDRIAKEEGFRAWSLLAARVQSAEAALLPRLANGEMILLAARPGQGKTLAALRLLLDAVREGRQSVLFTLDLTAEEARDRFLAIDRKCDASMPEIVTSDGISAELIVRHLSDSRPGTVAVVDYLQILDQQRTKPPLDEQMKILHKFAEDAGVIMAFISQIDRAFDPRRAPVPKLADIRLPNPVPARVFSKACFLHAGKIHFQKLNQATLGD
ncbi:MAG: DNA helicase [Novosphingobium sp.]